MLKALTELFRIRRASDTEATDRRSFTELMRKLGDGWQIEPPVYVMADPTDRSHIVFHFVVWRAGRPQVATVRDGAEIRQFVADQHLRQESS